MITEEIPLASDTTDQLLDVVLDGDPYTLRVLWNEQFGYFSLSILTRDGDMLLENIKMVKNYPLIGRFKDIRLPSGDLYFVDIKQKNIRPIYESIGTGDYALIYHVPDVVEAVQSVTVQQPGSISGSIWDSGLSEWDGGASIWDSE